jgi:hypothetical protein
MLAGVPKRSCIRFSALIGIVSSRSRKRKFFGSLLQGCNSLIFCRELIRTKIPNLLRIRLCSQSANVNHRKREVFECVCTDTNGRRFSPLPRISPAAGPCPYASRRKTADERIFRRNTRNARRPRLRGSTACCRRRSVAPPCGLLFRPNQRLSFLFLKRKQGLGGVPGCFVLRGNRHRTFPESGIKLGRNRAKIGDGQPRSKESSGCTNEGSGFHAGGEEARRPLGTRGL